MKRSGFEVQSATVMALFLREIRTRFGEYRLGYAWAVLEPAFHIGLTLVLFGVLMARAMPDISYPVFLINGVVPWLMFNSVATRSLKAIEANSGLFSYRPVKPIDTLVARSWVESLIFGQVYIVLTLLMWALGDPIRLDDLPLLIASLLLLLLFSFGFGLVLMVVGDISKEIAKVVTLAFRPLYLVSGIMFSLHSIPEQYHAYILWNPVIHAIELARHAVFHQYDAQHVSLAYLAGSTLVVLFVGLVLYRHREEAMLTT